VTMKRKIEPVSYPMIDILALAFAVQRITGKFQQYDENSTAETKFQPSNRRLMQEHVDGNPVLVIEQDYEDARQAADILINHKVLTMLSDGFLSEFKNKLATTVQGTSVTTREFGLLAYAPSVSAKILAKQAEDAKLQELVYTSQHIGSLNAMTQFTITVLDSKYITRLGCYLVFGYTPDDNCVSYFTNDKDKLVDGTYRGRVKAHTVDDWRKNVKVTRFSHVKHHLTREQEISNV